MTEQGEAGRRPDSQASEPRRPCSALACTIELAKTGCFAGIQVRILIPDRIGVAARTYENGEVKYRYFTGNQMGLMLLDYILDAKRKAGKLPNNSFAVTTMSIYKACQTCL